jgi:hypothetical protein
MAQPRESSDDQGREAKLMGHGLRGRLRATPAGKLRSGALAAAVVAAALLALAQPAFAAAPQITGTVTSAVTKAPLAGVEVCEYPVEGGKDSGCSKTNAEGEYVLGVGRAGTFVLSFKTTIEGLIPETIYDGVFEGSEATRVNVGEGATVSGIDQAIEEGGRITGRVRDSATHEPIAGIEACAELPSLGTQWVRTHRTCTTTNAGGEYAIKGLTPGEGVPEGGYEVEFTDSLDYIRQFYNGKLERYDGTTRIPVKPATTVANIDAELEQGGEISGRVTSQVNGDPVGGAEVCAGEALGGSACTKTNAAGEYTISRLPSGEYRVYFSGPGGVGTEYLSQYYDEKEGPEAEPVKVTAPLKVGGINASLKAYGSITGTVIDKQTKQPLQGVNVCIAGGACQDTDATGQYSFTRLLAGSYALNFYAGRLNEEAGTDYLSQYEANEYIVQEELKARNPEAANVKVTMGGRPVIDDELEEGGRITGIAHVTGTEAGTFDWPCVEDLSTGHPAQSRICPGSEYAGPYTVSGLPPGRYRVVFGNYLPAYYFTQYYHDKDQQSEAQEVSVASGQTVEHVDADLITNPDPWEGAIAGTLTDAANKPIAGIEVCPLDDGTSTRAAACATTNQLGEYLIPGLVNGEYEVEFSSPANGTLDYIRQRYGGGTPVSVLWGSITPSIDGQLAQGGSIAGVAQNAVTGQPAAGASVCAYNGLGKREVCARTEPDGAYSLPGLAPGSYTAGFETTEASGQYFPQYYDEADSAAAARQVAVEAGHSTTSIDGFLYTHALPGDGAIAGVVTDASTSAPLAGIDVCAYSIASEGLFGECAVSGAGGHYLLPGLGAGAYELEFSSPANGAASYVDTLYEAGEPVQVEAGAIADGRDAGLQIGARLTGTVTSAATGLPAAKVLACASDEAREVEACAPSTSDGSFAITGLPAGRYSVLFSGSAAGFANQYYDEADTLAAAKTVALAAGATAGDVNARMQGAGSISGLVTSAATGRALANAIVCAFSAQEAPVECAASEGDGDYTIGELPPGEWRVGFEDGAGYQLQFYDGVSEFNAATAVTLAPGTAIERIDAALLAPGAKPVPPPPPSTTPHSAAPGAGTPGAGSGVLGSTSTKPPAAPSLSLASRTIVLAGHAVRVELLCATAACTGSVELRLKVSVAAGSRQSRHRRLETVVLARGSFALPASGVHATVRVTLTAAGRRLLARLRGHSLASTLSIALAGKAPVARSVRLVAGR